LGTLQSNSSEDDDSDATEDDDSDATEDDDSDATEDEDSSVTGTFFEDEDSLFSLEELFFSVDSGFTELDDFIHTPPEPDSSDELLFSKATGLSLSGSADAAEELSPQPTKAHAAKPIARKSFFINPSVNGNVTDIMQI
jgi:hypothetical protein